MVNAFRYAMLGVSNIPLYVYCLSIGASYRQPVRLRVVAAA